MRQEHVTALGSEEGPQTGAQIWLGEGEVGDCYIGSWKGGFSNNRNHRKIGVVKEGRGVCL